MKTQLKRFSKSALSVVLSMCMLISCMTVGLVATDAAKLTGDSLSAKADSESTGTASEVLVFFGICSDMQEWKGSGYPKLNVWGGTSEGVKDATATGDTYLDNNRTYTMYYATVYNDNTNVQAKLNDSWYSGTVSSADLTTNNAYFFCNSASGWDGQWGQTYQKTSNVSLSSSSTSITTAQTATLTPSLSSNNTYNEIKSTAYSVTTNPNSAGSVTSGGVFSATAAGTYTVTATVTYNAKGFSDITKTDTATKEITVTANTYQVSVTAGSNGDAYIGTTSNVTGTDTELSFTNGTTNTVYVKASPAAYYKVSSWSPTPTSTTENNGVVTAQFSVSSETEISVTFEEDPVYCVAGSEGLTGYSWNTSQNVMTKNGSSYTKTFNNIAAGTYEFKIVKNNSWDGAIGYSSNVSRQGLVTSVSGEENNSTDSNIRFVTSQSANITITFTPTRTIVIDAVSNETKYTVTVQSVNTDYGTVASGSVQAGNINAVSLPTPTAKYGYKFVNWTTTDSTITITDADKADEATVKATGVGTVTANFAPDTSMNLYIAGRFRVRESEGSNNWKYSFDNNNWSDTGDDNIKLTYDSGTIYKLETFASPAELSAQISSNDPWFSVYDKDNTKGWHTTSDSTLGSTTEVYLTSNSTSANAKFSSASNDTPVTLYFNVVSKKLWYVVPNYYDVTVTSSTGGTVTADPVRAEAGTEIELTVTSEQGYQLTSITATQDGVAGPIQITNNKFNMPAGDVTVTPVFSAINYTGITYSAKYSTSENADTDDTTYTEDLSGAITSSPSSGTYVNGININASKTNYTFYKWVATGGTFTKGSNVTTSTTANTTFYPTQNGATLKALFKMKYNISLTQGTHGTISVDHNSLSAGDTYQITAVPDSKYRLSSLVINGTDVISSTSMGVYTGKAGGSSASIIIQATFELIPTTKVRINKNIANSADLHHAYFWYCTDGTTQTPVVNWPGERISSDSDWTIDTDYPDYYVRQFEINWGDFQMILNNGSGGNVQTPDSDEYETGYDYYIDAASSNQKPVLTKGLPTYTVVGEKEMMGGSTRFDVANTDNDMTAGTNGTFTLTKSNVPKSSGYANGYGYKVVTDHNYTYGEYPGSEVNQNIPVLYNHSTVSFTYTPSAASSKLTAVVSGGDFVANVTAEHGTVAIGTDSSVSGSATSQTLNATKTYTADTVNSGYTSHTVYVKATPATHYEVSGWSQTPVSTTKNGDVVIAQFTVNGDITITPTITKKQHNVTFTNQNTGGTVKVNDQSTSPQVVNEAENYSIEIVPARGYMLNAFTINGVNKKSSLSGSDSAGWTLTTEMGNTDEALAVEFVLEGYSLTGVVSPGHGQLTFYSDSGFENAIDTATYQQTVYIKYTTYDDYQLKGDFVVVGSDGHGAVSTNREAGTGSFTMGSSKATVNAYVMLQYGVNYYVDVHNTDMSNNKSVNVTAVDSSGNPLTNAAGQTCSANVSRVNSQTSVYSATINTPFEENEGAYEPIGIKITYNNGSENPPVFTKNLTAQQVAILKNTKEVWLESVNEASQEFSMPVQTAQTPVTDITSGNRRIYLAKPASLTDSAWNEIGVYYWDSVDGTDNGWLTGTHMTKLGSDGSYTYYRVDIPKLLDNDPVDYIIFQGWKNSTSSGGTGFAPSAQTDDISISDSSLNYFVLSKDGSSYTATSSKDTNVTVPNYSKYYTNAYMNVDVYSTKPEGTKIKVTPTTKCELVTYSSSNTGVVTVISNSGEADNNGKITPVASGSATITVKVYGTVGKRLYEAGVTNNTDYISYNVTVNISDPSKLNSFELMSLESAEYSVEIPKQSGNQPAYFDMSGVEITVTGIKGLTSSTNSAIITESSEGEVIINTIGEISESGTTYPVKFTVKYAKPMTSNGFLGYDNIAVSGMVTTKSVRTSGGQRYGLSEDEPWKCRLNNGTESNVSCTPSKTVNGGVETAVTKGITFNPSYNIYRPNFVPYSYVDVTFSFSYYEYNPETVDGMKNYPYDPVWAGNEDESNSKFAASHIQKTYTVQHYEVRGKTADGVQPSDLIAPAVQAIKAMPSNSYYYYSINAGSITISSRSTGTFSANASVAMVQHVQYYQVYVNGSEIINPKSNQGYTYQEYAEPEVDNASKWYAVQPTTNDTTAQNVSTSNAPLLAMGKSYKFRVIGDTYLRVIEGVDSTLDINRSENNFSHHELTHIGESEQTKKQFLLQNFYIADYFDKEKVMDLARGVDSNNNYSKADDPTFVGGGVVYYSIKDGIPNSNAVGKGYVNNDGTINSAAIKQMLTDNIYASVNQENYPNCGLSENNPYETLASAIGTEDAMRVAYGTEIKAQQYIENGDKTGILFRYLPYETFSNNSNDWVSGVPQKNADGNYITTVNKNTFRYSNSMKAYQYVYASGNENKETNNGRNMRLYSYYVYSYLSYNKETNVPETQYEIILSDHYSDASTYWAGNANPTEN